MKKELINRNNIYIGKLVEPINISVEKYQSKYKKLSQEEQKMIGNYGHNICQKETIRPILFTLDENNLARDIIYKINTNYPVLELNSCSQRNNIYIVENILQIDKLLSCLEYKEFLNKHELKKIYQQLIISSKWLKQNRELFGYVEIMPDVYIETEKGQFSSEMYEKLEKLHIMIRKKPTIRELS